MSIDGTWQIVTKTPIGNQEATLVLQASGNKLTGKMIAAGGSSELADGVVDGTHLSWKVTMTRPFPVTLECTAAVEGDQISGNAKAGMFGTSPFTGKRA